MSISFFAIDASQISLGADSGEIHNVQPTIGERISGSDEVIPVAGDRFAPPTHSSPPWLGPEDFLV
ncbi:hypothetical protein [Mycobacterium leprae]|uniref:hypothetical protein n=1 Tax=Mycobacterium leprae TaxID=1769 RepID=UPI0019550FA6|nr:hypothetical protein [Mycobacterium leprae]